MFGWLKDEQFNRIATVNLHFKKRIWATTTWIRRDVVVHLLLVNKGTRKFDIQGDTRGIKHKLIESELLSNIDVFEWYKTGIDLPEDYTNDRTIESVEEDY